MREMLEMKGILQLQNVVITVNYQRKILDQYKICQILIIDFRYFGKIYLIIRQYEREIYINIYNIYRIFFLNY